MLAQINKDTTIINKRQKPSISPDSLRKTFYCNFFTLGFGGLFSASTPGKLQVTFPYFVTNSAGNTINKTFTSSIINPSKKSQTNIMLNLEMGNLRYGINVFASASSYSNIGRIGVGYGRNYFLSLPTKKKNKKQIIIQPSISICYSAFSRGDSTSYGYLGVIDNNNTNINIAGYSAAPTYTVTSGKSIATENAKELNIFYSQKDWAFMPKISIRNNQHIHTLHFEVDISYFLPFTKSEGILLYQDNFHSIVNGNKIVGFNNTGITATYNGKTVTATPYSISGFCVGATVGVNINYKNTRKGSKLFERKKKATKA